MSAVDKRLYYLMLSPSEGQGFAEGVGFSMPSEDVQEAETYDVIGRWSLMASAGVLETAIETADWMLEIPYFGEVPSEMQEHFKKLLIAHSMAFLNKLLDTDQVALMALVEMVDDDE